MNSNLDNCDIIIGEVRQQQQQTSEYTRVQPSKPCLHCPGKPAEDGWTGGHWEKKGGKRQGGAGQT